MKRLLRKHKKKTPKKNKQTNNMNKQTNKKNKIANSKLLEMLTNAYKHDIEQLYLRSKEHSITFQTVAIKDVLRRDI